MLSRKYFPGNHEELNKPVKVQPKANVYRTL